MSITKEELEEILLIAKLSDQLVSVTFSLVAPQAPAHDTNHTNTNHTNHSDTNHNHTNTYHETSNYLIHPKRDYALYYRRCIASSPTTLIATDVIVPCTIFHYARGNTYITAKGAGPTSLHPILAATLVADLMIDVR